MINFGFKGVSPSNLQSKYDDLSKVNSDDRFNVLSYISSHDDGLYNRSNIVDGGTDLLIAPGAVQVFYGDETARPLAWPGTAMTKISEGLYSYTIPEGFGDAKVIFSIKEIANIQYQDKKD